MLNIRHKYNTDVCINNIDDNCHAVRRDIFSTRVTCVLFSCIQTMVLRNRMIITITDVQLPDSCVRLVKHDGPMTWAQARVNCVRLGGMMASLSRAQHWLYVSRALRHHFRREYRIVHIYIGLLTSPDGFPSM